MARYCGGRDHGRSRYPRCVARRSTRVHGIEVGEFATRYGWWMTISEIKMASKDIGSRITRGHNADLFSRLRVNYDNDGRQAVSRYVCGRRNQLLEKHSGKHFAGSSCWRPRHGACQDQLDRSHRSWNCRASPHSALRSSGTSPNFRIALASLKSPVAGSPVRLNATIPPAFARLHNPTRIGYPERSATLQVQCAIYSNWPELSDKQTIDRGNIRRLVL